VVTNSVYFLILMNSGKYYCWLSLSFHFVDADLDEIRPLLPPLLDGMCVRKLVCTLYLFGLVNECN
jgi:hypothetical protein